ncbi:hypothetical protein F7725_007573, partial [Dissostichus mawsoni]
MDGTRRQMVNLLVADMIEVHGFCLLKILRPFNVIGWDSDLSSILLLVHLLPQPQKAIRRVLKLARIKLSAM